MHTIPYEGVRSLSQFLSGAAMKEVERLEAKYNNGKPFPPVRARELSQGRPMGERAIRDDIERQLDANSAARRRVRNDEAENGEAHD